MLSAERGGTGAEYNRLQQAIGALDERIFDIDTLQYDCAR
jgi:hypothetical protein